MNIVQAAFTCAALIVFAHVFAGQAARAIFNASQAEAEYWER